MWLPFVFATIHFVSIGSQEQREARLIVLPPMVINYQDIDFRNYDKPDEPDKPDQHSNDSYSSENDSPEFTFHPPIHSDGIYYFEGWETLIPGFTGTKKENKDVTDITKLTTYEPITVTATTVSSIQENIIEKNTEDFGDKKKSPETIQRMKFLNNYEKLQKRQREEFLNYYNRKKQKRQSKDTIRYKYWPQSVH